MTDDNSKPAADEAAALTDAERIAQLFTRSEGGAFHFARWARPIAPAVFGTDEQGQAIMTAGIEEAAEIAGLDVVDEDPEFEKNCLVFFCKDWGDLAATPGLDRLVPDLAKLISLLGAAGANQYRIFSFDEAGGIRLAIVLIRYDADMSSISPQALALNQAVQTLLLWSDAAFTAESPTALQASGRGTVKPWFARLLAAAYASDGPSASQDLATAEVLAAALPPAQEAA
ncbi:MAG: hypothetical protein AAFU68_06250 [Pseudomonadota bacterium]